MSIIFLNLAVRKLLLKLKVMKKLITIMCAGLLTFSVYAQPDQGSLLLEGQLSGSWTEVALNDATVFGIYLTDNFALVMGWHIGLIDDETLNSSFGLRKHFNDQALFYSDYIIEGPDYIEDASIKLGVGNRFYANDWLAFEPRAGVTYDGYGMRFHTSIGVSVFFEKP